MFFYNDNNWVIARLWFVRQWSAFLSIKRRHSETLIYNYRLPLTPVPSINIFTYNFCHGLRGIILSREIGGQLCKWYIYMLFSNVIVQSIGKDAEHRSSGLDTLNYRFRYDPKASYTCYKKAQKLQYQSNFQIVFHRPLYWHHISVQYPVISQTGYVHYAVTKVALFRFERQLLSTRTSQTSHLRAIIRLC